MKDQHKHIKGYRDLTQEEVELMNALKELGSAVGEAVEELEDLPFTDKRWVAIAKTDLQKGFMALIRSVAQPEGF